MTRVLVLSSLLLTGVAVAQQSPHGRITMPCDACHSTQSWKMRTDARFNHASTGFELKGRHRVIRCASCHQDLVFFSQRSDCVACHTDVHKSELGSDCLRCHTMNSWVVPDMKQKHQQTRFPLVGKHMQALCSQCHDRASTQRYAGTPSACIGCHQEEYGATTAPSHAASGFQVDCSGCHKVTAAEWSGSFDHNITAFPLTGAHRAVVCSECHRNNQFKGTSSECYSCHAADYAGAVGHQSGNFSHDCRMCHSTTAWQPATFDHQATGFPLTGAHATAQCQTCHINNNYQLTYTDCYQCHQDDFQRPTDPNHVTANFSHDCTPCHTTSAWMPSTFDHDAQFFRIYSGKHQGKWSSCLICHTNPVDYRQYSCLNCHEHDRTPMDDKHSQVPGYVYSSSACYSCHRGA